MDSQTPQFLSVGGVAIHHRVIGDPTRQPSLVFANSLGTDFRIWHAVASAFAEDFALILFDKRGHGLSDVADTPYAMDDHVDDLEGLLASLGISRAVICGISVGGLIAQGLYARRPDLVRALILCDTGHRIGDAASWNTRIEAVSQRGIASIADQILERWFSAHFRANRTTNLAGYRNMLTRTPVAGYVGTCAAIRDVDFTGQAPAIAVPSLCMVGEEDGATTPDLVCQLAGLIPGARYEVIAGAGHLPCIEQPRAVIDLMRDFLSALPKENP